MKILVPCKRVPDTDQRIRVVAGTPRIDDQGLPYVINPFDAIALEESLRMREASAATHEILAVGIGTEAYEEQLRTALAMGADRAIRVDAPAGIDPWNVAQLLARLVHAEAAMLVLMGKQAVDDDANQAGQFLAAILGWPQATFASRIEFLTDSELRVQRETDFGLESVRIQLPAVITTDLRLNEPRYASLPSILKARKKTLEVLTLDQLGYTLEPRVELLELSTVNTARSCRRVASVEELLQQLHSRGKLRNGFLP